MTCFGDGWDALSLSEIAQQTGLSTGGAQRITHTLTQLGYLRKDARTRRYRPSPRMLEFTYQFMRASPLYEVAIPVVIGLRDETQETVNVSLLDQTDAVVLIRMPSQRRINPSSVIGRRIPAWAVSTGRAILSRLSEEEARAIIDAADLEVLTPRTETDPDRLLDLIAEARAEGFALVEEQSVLGEISLAAPIIDGAGRPIAALGITTSTAYWTPDSLRERLAPLVMRAANTVSRSLQGWKEF
ncbi:helix-turn-helix domain-containing protein [Hyphomicrobiales bacterium FT118]|uniref:Helix-turn-helix domain-containing protein n=2 Tax=Futiania mangrovi TaxID=2959716 RepID=A0A9J6PBX3_9PROT|nr:helix-turn-helix domain-containing protein [Futiania mangrovii]